ncbi:hypothetical protein D3C73_1262310 [compost metagenome]
MNLAPRRRPRLPGNFFTSQKSAQPCGALASFFGSYVRTVDQMKIPTPQSLTAAGMKSSFLPMRDQSNGSNRPSLQPRNSSGDSTSTTSQLVFPVSAMTRILAISPL